MRSTNDDIRGKAEMKGGTAITKRKFYTRGNIFKEINSIVLMPVSMSQANKNTFKSGYFIYKYCIKSP